VGGQLADRRFTGLLEAVPDAMVCVDADGRIAVVNAQAERLFGYARDELIGQPVEILVPDQARKVHHLHRAGYVADPRPRPMGTGIELAARRRDGSTFPAEISLSAVDTGDGIVVAAAVRDVTGRRLAAETASGLASTIQSPRDTVIRDQLLTSWNPGAERLNGYVDQEQVQRGTERAAALTHQTPALARQEVTQARALNLSDIVAGVEPLLLRTMGEHVELITDLASDLPLVLADPGRIEQVLVNLALNARDAMPGGGKLTIQTTSAQIGEPAATLIGLPRGPYVMLKVSDTGCGIPKHILHRVFEPFFSTKPQGEGTGLGLATVHGVITQAGGNVRIYSEPGMGTTLTAYLPVTAARTAATPALAAPQAGGGQIVLVVEDEPVMREVTRRILADNGYQVTAAASGPEALAALTDRLDHIDVLLTDIVMPQMQGNELAAKVLALHPGTRVVFMSGYTKGLLSAQGVLEPGHHLIEKPFSEPTLLSTMHEVLSAPQDHAVRGREPRDAESSELRK
jgi:two-component system, cell cycle sensor histidine kinase and response regulator CckA